MTSILQKHPELMDLMYRGSKTMKMITGPEGQVYDANDATLEKLKYTLVEFVRTDKPVLWTDFTFPDSDLEADMDNAAKCVSGVLPRYELRKRYIPKDSAIPFKCDIHVFRYPPRGDASNFEFFYVEAYPVVIESEETNSELRQLMATQMTMSDQWKKDQEELKKTMQEVSKTTPAAMIIWLQNNPKVGVPVVVFFATLLFGNRVIEVIQAAKELF